MLYLKDKIQVTFSILEPSSKLQITFENISKTDLVGPFSLKHSVTILIISFIDLIICYHFVLIHLKSLTEVSVVWLLKLEFLLELRWLFAIIF